MASTTTATQTIREEEEVRHLAAYLSFRSERESGERERENFLAKSSTFERKSHTDGSKKRKEGKREKKEKEKREREEKRRKKREEKRSKKRSAFFRFLFWTQNCFFFRRENTCRIIAFAESFARCCCCSSSARECSDAKAEYTRELRTKTRLKIRVL